MAADVAREIVDRARHLQYQDEQSRSTSFEFVIPKKITKTKTTDDRLVETRHRLSFRHVTRPDPNPPLFRRSQTRVCFEEAVAEFDHQQQNGNNINRHEIDNEAADWQHRFTLFVDNSTEAAERCLPGLVDMVLHSVRMSFRMALQNMQQSDLRSHPAKMVFPTKSELNISEFLLPNLTGVDLDAFFINTVTTVCRTLMYV